jgi:hypothetical protein
LHADCQQRRRYGAGEHLSRVADRKAGDDPLAQTASPDECRHDSGADIDYGLQQACERHDRAAECRPATSQYTERYTDEGGDRKRPEDEQQMLAKQPTKVGGEKARDESIE